MSNVDTAALDRALASAVDCGDLPSVAATAAAGNDVVYEGAFGVREIGGDTPMTIDTVLWIASMAEAVIAAAAMQLVEQGKLDLDEPAGEVIGPLAEVQVLDGFDACGEPVLRPPTSSLTLRHLLTHTSGYGYDVWSRDLIRYRELKGLPSVISCARAALDTALLFDPGEERLYGIGVDWAGLMIEEVTGDSLGDHLRDNIFEPLAMASTGMEITDDMRARLASVHTRTETAQLAVMPFEVSLQPEFRLGGGGLYTTVSDYLRFLRAILGGGELGGSRILRASTVEVMSGDEWGLGFLVDDRTSQKWRRAGSTGWAGLANSYYWVDVSNDNCGVWSTQLFPFADDAALGSFADFEAIVQGRRNI